MLSAASLAPPCAGPHRHAIPAPLHADGLAPPCAGPHRHAIPAAMHANGLAPDEPDRRTVEVEAFCSWSACRMKMRSSAFTSTGLTLYSSAGTANIMRMKLAV